MRKTFKPTFENLLLVGIIIGLLFLLKDDLVAFLGLFSIGLGANLLINYTASSLRGV